MQKRPSQQELIEELERRGIVVRIPGVHFVYTSGKHGSEYIDKNALMANTALSSWMAETLALKWFLETNTPFPEVVVGPAMSGAILAQLVAQELRKVPSWSDDEPMYAAFVEKDERGLFRLKRGYAELVRDRPVLIVEDVTNTGTTALAAAHAVIEAGGLVVGIAVIWNRSEVEKLVLKQADGSQLEMPITALIHHPFPSMTEDQCKERGPCARGELVSTTFGHGSGFLARNKPRC